jgi:hypothetical protein
MPTAVRVGATKTGATAAGAAVVIAAAHKDRSGARLTEGVNVWKR